MPYFSQQPQMTSFTMAGKEEPPPYDGHRVELGNSSLSLEEKADNLFHSSSLLPSAVKKSVDIATGAETHIFLGKSIRFKEVSVCFCCTAPASIFPPKISTNLSDQTAPLIHNGYL